MDQLTNKHLLELLAKQEPPCISLYQPTHRHRPANEADPIVFKNLMRDIENSLRQHYPTRDVRSLMEPFQKIARDSLFWKHTRDGLAVFAGLKVFDVFQLQRPFPELAVVADSYHVKPLLRYLQSGDRFQVLGLTRDSVAVYVGNRYVLDAEPLPEGFPSKLAEVVPPEESERGESVASSSAGVGSPKMFRGHGEGKYDKDTEKFFRAVDRAVTDHFSKPSGLPLVLVALSEHQSLFRRISQNPLLLGDGVAINPTVLKADELRKQVWQVLEPHYLARLAELKENFTTAQARQSGSCDLSDVARAAVAGRVGTLLIESERILPGIIDRSTGEIRSGNLSAPSVDDMLDDLAELVLTHGGEVVVVPRDRMPTTTGLAAIYRF